MADTSSQPFVISVTGITDTDAAQESMRAQAEAQAQSALGEATLDAGTYKFKQGDTPVPGSNPPVYTYDGTFTVTATQVAPPVEPSPPTPTPPAVAPEPAPTPVKTPTPPAPEPTPPADEITEIVIVGERPKPEPIQVDGAQTVNKVSHLRENPLSAFSSYTYNLSLYMINPDTFNDYSSGGKAVPADWKLLCRSGGINNTSSLYTEADAVTTSPRANGFDLDYYIDNLRIVTNISSKETLTASNSFGFSFQIMEPYGFKFPAKLIAAAREIQASSTIKRSGSIAETVIALQTQYMLVMRFYGYDKDGAVIKGDDFPQADVVKTDPEAVFERSFPITFTGFDFKLDSKMVVYNVKASLVSELYALGRYRGFTEDNITIKGATVNEALGGSTGDDPTAKVTGLMKALNDKQEELLKAGKIGVKDVYELRIADKEIADAFLVDTESTGKEKTPTTAVTGSSGANARTENKPAVVYKRTRPYTINKGDSILTAIDQIITQSSYITRALNIKDNEKVEEINSNTEDDFSKNTPVTLAWYNVVPQVQMLPFDDIRNTFACKITYVIQKYETPYIRALSLGTRSKYPGPHKRYKHWYMSNDLKENKHQKEVIGYEQGYNLLYFNLGGYGNEAPAGKSGDKAPNAPVTGGSNPTGKLAGVLDKTLTPIKTFLYSPSDQLKARITVLGDPDYLMTSTSRGYEIAIKKWYGEDNWSINPNTGQVFIEIDFRDAEDYDSDSGLLQPSQDGDTVFWNYPPDVAKTIQGVAYMVWQVTSTFSRGVFTQELKTSIPPFGEDPSSNDKSGKQDARISIETFDKGTGPSDSWDSPTAPIVPAKSTAPTNNTPPKTSIGQGVQAILNPAPITGTPTLTQIQTSTEYIEARKAGKTPQEAIDIATKALTGKTSDTQTSPSSPTKSQNVSGVVVDDAIVTASAPITSEGREA